MKLFVAILLLSRAAVSGGKILRADAIDFQEAWAGETLRIQGKIRLNDELGLDVACAETNNCAPRVNLTLGDTILLSQRVETFDDGTWGALDETIAVPENIPDEHTVEVTIDNSEQNLDFLVDEWQIECSPSTGECPRWETTGWHNGDRIAEFPGSSSPNGETWHWGECAKKCSETHDCEFWTLRLTANKACILLKNQGEFHPDDKHIEGPKDPFCVPPIVTDGENYKPSRSCTAYSYGDPHMTTFDGLQYDVHALGEVILLKSLDSEFEIQGRMEQARDDVKFKPAVTTGVVVRESTEKDLPVIQVSMANDPETPGNVFVPKHEKWCPVEIYIDGEQVELEAGTGWDDVTYKIKRNKITLEYPEVRITLKASFFGRCFFSIDYTLLDDCRSEERLLGLLGSPNGESSDDWMTRNGTSISIPEGGRRGRRGRYFEPAYEYSTTNWCITDPEESFFAYEEGKSFADYAHCEIPYDPELENEINNIDNVDPDLKQLCEEDLGCLLEGITLGIDAAKEEIENPANNRTEDGTCTKWETPGWHKGDWFAIYPASSSPNGESWHWEECAMKCAETSECEFWTLRLEGDKACILLKNKGDFHPRSDHIEGPNDPDCLEPEGDGVCSKYESSGWHRGEVISSRAKWMSPDKVKWTWEQCAKECAMNDECEFWTLRLDGNGACILKKGREKYFDTGNHMEGSRDLDCLNVEVPHMRRLRGSIRRLEEDFEEEQCSEPVHLNFPPEEYCDDYNEIDFSTDDEGYPTGSTYVFPSSYSAYGLQVTAQRDDDDNPVLACYSESGIENVGKTVIVPFDPTEPRADPPCGGMNPMGGDILINIDQTQGEGMKIDLFNIEMGATITTVDSESNEVGGPIQVAAKDGLQTVRVGIRGVAQIVVSLQGHGSVSKLHVCHDPYETPAPFGVGYAPPTPSESPHELVILPPENGGGGYGDPHLKTWRGHVYDFHGECDLVLAKSLAFRKGLGFEAQIRTSIRDDWSFISSVAVKIGEDVFEVQSGGIHLLNGVEDVDLKTTTLAGYQVKKHGGKKDNGTIKARYHINMKEEGVLEVKVYNEFVSVLIRQVRAEDFNDSVGLMGTFEQGELIGRDTSTVFEDPNEFGLEWQVRDTDTMLFQEARFPQFPAKCTMPEVPSSVHRRLNEVAGGAGMIPKSEAEKACEHLPVEDRDACVYDVVTTGDIEMARLDAFDDVEDNV